LFRFTTREIVISDLAILLSV